MYRWLTLAALAVTIVAAPASAAGLTGQYVEARTCDVFTAACFANAEINLGGKNAILGWKIDQGCFDNIRLDGLGVVAILATSDTLGLKQTAAGKAVLIVDSKANRDQREALIRFVKRQAGDLVSNVVEVQSAPVDVTLCQCKEGGCARLQAGKARIETRCIDQLHDKGCGNDTAFYPPLAKDVKATIAMAVESSYTGTGFRQTWSESLRRGAYVGTFTLN